MFTWTIVKRKIKVVAKKKRNSSYLLHKEAARTLILERLEYFNQEQLFTYNRVAIRDQKRCWGSCSSKGNLNFSYKLLFLPPCLRDYIIVHELCHLKVLNHSDSFWTVVGSHMPDYEIRMKLLRQLEKTCGTSLAALKNYQMKHTCSSCEQEVGILK
jgi:predicted metal-dependent hydrolase